MRNLFLILFFFPTVIFGQHTINDSILHDNVYRGYKIYIPAIYDAAQSTPLVLNFHGLTGTSTIAMWHADFRPIADTANFIIVHPQGLLDNSGVTHWNVGQVGTVIYDIDFVSKLLPVATTFAVPFTFSFPKAPPIVELLYGTLNVFVEFVTDERLLG